MGQPYVSFGNLRLTKGWTLDYQAGSAPSVCTIRSVPHLDYLDQHGTLVIGETGRGELRLTDCLLLSPQFNEDRTWELPILDRRWKWAYGQIDGVYNIQRPDKTFIRERKPHELAESLLLAMGERRGSWDISRLPDFARPEVDWTNQNPAAMFDDLVRALGCVWTLDYFRDGVVIWPIGEGLDLPEAETISRQRGATSLAKPDTIVVRGARTLFQYRFATEAVAKDTDGQIKRLSELKGYKIDDHDDPGDFSGIDEDETYTDHGEEKKVRDLASEWAFKTYRVTGFADGSGWCPDPLALTGYAPQSFWDLEFIDTRAEQEIDDLDIGPDGIRTGRRVNKPIRVEAIYFSSDDNEAQPTTDYRTYTGHCTFEPKLGLVRFSEPLYKIKSNPSTNETAFEAATVLVDVGFYASNQGTFARPVAEIKTGERRGTGPRIVVKDEVESRIIQWFSRKTKTTSEQQPPDINTQLEYYGRAALQEYEPMPTLTRTYHGLLPIVPDGRIRQVTWSGGDGQPARTQVSINTEHNPYVPTVEDTRRRQAVEDLLRIPAWQRLSADRKALTAQFG